MQALLSLLLTLALVLPAAPARAQTQAVTVDPATKVLVSPDATTFRLANGMQEENYILDYIATLVAPEVFGIGFLEMPDAAAAKAYLGIGGPINVADYGAVGDSTGAVGNGTDNTSAIQAAIAALEASTMKSTLYFPKGNYRVATSTTETLYPGGPQKRVLKIGAVDLAGRDIQIIGDDATITYDVGDETCCFAVQSSFRSFTSRGVRLVKTATARTANNNNGNDGYYFYPVIEATPRTIECIDLAGTSYSNCHPAASFNGRGNRLRGKLLRVVVDGCRFLNPYGGNRTALTGAEGNGCQLNYLHWVRNLSANGLHGDCGWEGTNNATYNTYGSVKDGVLFGECLNTEVVGGEYRHAGVETIFAQPGYALIGAITATFTMPAQNDTATVTVSLQSQWETTYTNGTRVWLTTGNTPTLTGAWVTVRGSTTSTLTFSFPVDAESTLTAGQTVTIITTNVNIYEAGVSPQMVTVRDAKLDMTNSPGATAYGTTAPIAGGVFATGRLNASGNTCILGSIGSSGIACYPPTDPASVQTARGVRITNNQIIGAANSGSGYMYGIKCYADDAIITGNVGVFANNHRVIGILNGGARAHLAGNRMLATTSVNHTYIGTDRSVGIAFDPLYAGKSGAMLDGNATGGFDVGHGGAANNQNFDYTAINHSDATSTLAEDLFNTLIQWKPLVTPAFIAHYNGADYTVTDSNVAYYKMTPGTTEKNVGGMYAPAVTIVSNSSALNSVVTTLVPHGLSTGHVVGIAGVAGSNPTINGQRTVVVLSPTTFNFSPAIDTSAGSGGSGGTVETGLLTIPATGVWKIGGIAQPKSDISGISGSGADNNTPNYGGLRLLLIDNGNNTEIVTLAYRDKPASTDLNPTLGGEVEVYLTKGTVVYFRIVMYLAGSKVWNGSAARTRIWARLQP